MLGEMQLASGQSRRWELGSGRIYALTFLDVVSRVSCSGYRLSPIRLATLSPPRLVRDTSHIAAVPTALSVLACQRLENKQRTFGRR
jgi:hypothetical protein